MHARIRVRLREKFSGWFDPQMGASSALLHVRIPLGYDAECLKHGWKLVPFVMESLGAKGTEARQLLQRVIVWLQYRA